MNRLTQNQEGAQFIGYAPGRTIYRQNTGRSAGPRYIRDPDPAEYEDILGRYTSIKRWSAAPELKGAIRFGEYLRSKKILPAIAHTMQFMKKYARLMKKGYTHATILFCYVGCYRRNGFRYAGVMKVLTDRCDDSRDHCRWNTFAPRFLTHI